MKKMRLLSLAAVPMFLAQCAPGGCAPAPPAAEPQPVAPSCDPNYSGCVPIDSDVDCAGGEGNGPSYVAGPIDVIGTDIYDLDRDGNGIACEPLTP
jgi:hypothetical protein